MEGHGVDKFRDASLLATSATRSWSLLSAELRSHGSGEIGAFTPQNAEITQIISNVGPAVTSRSSGGVRQETAAVPGTMWLCPAGIREEATRLSHDIPEVLHVYMPPHIFLHTECEDVRGFRANDLRYQAEVMNPTVHAFTEKIVRELRCETSSGGLKMDELAVHLLATLSHDHAESFSSRRHLALGKGMLDRKRLDRVLEYIEANLDRDITVVELAEAACFSLFHFVRAFHHATGKPPHAYLSERRLDRAKTLLAYSNASLAEISLICRFSGQANFSKAFQRATGVSPGRYRTYAK